MTNYNVITFKLNELLLAEINDKNQVVLVGKEDMTRNENLKHVSDLLPFSGRYWTKTKLTKLAVLCNPSLSQEESNYLVQLFLDGQETDEDGDLCLEISDSYETRLKAINEGFSKFMESIRNHDGNQIRLGACSYFNNL
jgi:hypothetical protein